MNSLSRRNVWWRCRECGHEWQSVIYTRVNGGRCPVCEGREVKPGFNDLNTTDPVLCREWDSEMNGELTPGMVHRRSCRIVWWKGNCGHSWRGKIADRVYRGQGCTKCDQAFREMLPYLMILYYSWDQGVQVIAKESRKIGVPLDFYFPEFHSAIIFSRKGQCYLCHFVWQEDDSDEALARAVRSAFHYIGIHADIRMEKDRDILYECFRRWRMNVFHQVNQK